MDEIDKDVGQNLKNTVLLKLMKSKTDKGDFVERLRDKDFFDEVCHLAASAKSLTEVSSIVKTLSDPTENYSGNPSKFKSDLLTVCSRLKVVPPLFQEGKGKQTKFIEPVRATVKGRVRHLGIPESVFSHLEISEFDEKHRPFENDESYITIELKENRDKKRSVLLTRTSTEDVKKFEEETGRGST